MSTVVTGATGHLGRLVVEDLLERGVPASELVATGRSIDKLDDLAARGVTVRRADFDDPTSLDGLFAAGDRVLLVSGSEVGKRVPQHQALVDAAAAAGVAQLVYTSIPHADTTPMKLAEEHRLTEELITASGLPATFLRNSWYLEGYAGQVPTYLEHGAIIGSAGEGRISGATRADLAEAAAVVLSAPASDHVGRTYELGGDTAFTMAELAAAVSEATGQTVLYRDVPAEEHLAVLTAAGLPEPFPAILVDVDQATAGGALEVGHDLSSLLGRPTTTLAEALAG